MSDAGYQVEMRNICKRFGGVQALDHACLQVRRGEIHALMGENGAGKSTPVSYTHLRFAGEQPGRKSCKCYMSKYVHIV